MRYRHAGSYGNRLFGVDRLTVRNRDRLFELDS